MSVARIQIVGAGIIGLSCAWRLVNAGHSVCVVDTARPGRGASWAAAGMIAPAFEFANDPKPHAQMLAFSLESAALWPDFAASLDAANALDRGPFLSLSTIRDGNLDAQTTRLADAEIPFERLTHAEARALAPSLSESVTGGLVLKTDFQIDHRLFIDRMIERLAEAGVTFSSERRPADISVETMGWRTQGTHPVSGEAMSLSMRPSHPKQTLRCAGVYVVPKPDRTIIGATSRPGDTRTSADEHALDDLRARAAAFAPSVAEGAVIERWAGVRPATDDGAPLIGWINDKSIVAAGHYRNGILLAPATASLVADLIEGRVTRDATNPFRPDRFAPATSEG
ncbi:MAG: FAD-dependent oxidoreductase [Pseudomonadota bacterium]